MRHRKHSLHCSTRDRDNRRNAAERREKRGRPNADRVSPDQLFRLFKKMFRGEILNYDVSSYDSHYIVCNNDVLVRLSDHNVYNFPQGLTHNWCVPHMSGFSEFMRDINKICTETLRSLQQEPELTIVK